MAAAHIWQLETDMCSISGQQAPVMHYVLSCLCLIRPVRIINQPYVTSCITNFGKELTIKVL